MGRSLLALAASLLVVSCGGEPPRSDEPDAGASDAMAQPDATAEPDAAVEPDPTDAFFDPDRVLEISITLAPADWALLRDEPGSLTLSEAGTDPGAAVVGTITGEVFEL